VNAVAQCVGGEAAEDDRVNRADARAGEHGHDRFDDERHIDRDAVAFRDTERFQRVRELRHLGVQLAIRDAADLARLSLPQQRDLVAARGEVAVEAVVRRVERPADEPFRVRRIPLQHALPLRLPVELSGPFGPIGFRVRGRFGPDLGIADVRIAAELVGRRKLPVFLK
jgi:hypothetical protein